MLQQQGMLGMGLIEMYQKIPKLRQHAQTSVMWTGALIGACKAV